MAKTKTKDLEHIAGSLEELSRFARQVMAETRSQELGKQLLALGNLALSGTLFVQFLPAVQFSIKTVFLGVTTFALLYIAGYLLLGGGGD
jgi:hypothetical protein